MYGIRHGGDRKSDKIKANNVRLKNKNNVRNLSQEELAEQLGVNLRTLQQAKKLTTLSPEIQQLIEQGNISASTAARVIGTKLTQDEQRKFAQMIIGKEETNDRTKVF